MASFQAFKSATAPIIGVALLCTAWFEFTGLLYLRAGKKISQRIIAICAAGIGAVCLIAWGLLRGYQLKFAAGLAGNPLGDFLTPHPALAAIFFIFVTLGTLKPQPTVPK